MDKFSAMHVFVEIVDRGSLSAAAASLGKSLPTVVRILAGLEESLGVRLLRRTTRRMSLTDEGRGYLGRCRRILADVAEAEAALGSGGGELRGELRVTAPVRFGQMHVAPAVTAFIRRHAAVHVELLLLDRVVNLVEEGIDAAVRIGPLHDSSMMAKPVGRMRRVVCASPALLETLGEPAHPSVLRDKPCVVFGGLASAAWRFVEQGRELVVPVAGPFVCNHAATTVEACAAGLGFGLFLHYQVAPLVRAGGLRIVLDGFEPAPQPVSIVLPEARLLSARVRVFVDCMKTALRDDPSLA